MADPEKEYNLALIVIDNLRADHVSSYGYRRLTTPHLDERAARGTRFENCFTPTGWTLTACASIITGQLAEQHGLVDHNHRFQAPKLPHLLGDGYHRVAFTNNGNTIPNTISTEYLESLGMKRKPAKWKFFDWDVGFDEYFWIHREDHLSPWEKASSFLRERRAATRGGGSEKPYFLFFHTNLVHDYHMERDYYLQVEDWLGRPIHPELRSFPDGPGIWRDPPEGIDPGTLRDDIVAKYDSGIRFNDQCLEGLLDQIDFSNTVVVVISDHGEGFEPELGRVHHCGRLHQDLLHVPLFLWLPEELREKFPMPAVEKRPTSTIDVVPTLLTLVGQTSDLLPGRLLFDLSTHRRLTGVDRGYIYWREDCVRDSYDTCHIDIRSELTYPLKSIRVARNDSHKEFEYNLAYDPAEHHNLLDRRERRVEKLEPITFIVGVNDQRELEENLLASPVARSPRHQWILVDNQKNHRYQSISRLYAEATAEAEHDLVFFLHQDLYLPPGWEERLFEALAELEHLDSRWGVLGAVGVVAMESRKSPPSKELRGHWCDPHGYHRRGPLPAEVEALDEQWLGIRLSRGPSFDRDLPGFHCYGIDLSLAAREAGMKSYAIDNFVWHKFRDSEGHLITRREDSQKITSRWEEEFMTGFNLSAEYIEKKWSKYRPFQTTTWTWR